MAEPIPDKGRVLTAMSAFWFEQLRRAWCRSHLISTDLADLPDGAAAARAGRAGSCSASGPRCCPIECIVRGYLTGSAWKEYRAHGHHARHRAARRACSSRPQLPEPVFTPSTKADGRRPRREHLASSAAVDLIGAELAERARDVVARALPPGRRSGRAERGIIIADTKFELGLVDGELVLCDEVLTPDSSRFWPADAWQPGRTPPSFDKQPVRDYLDGLDWDKSPPPPPLPDEVVAATSARYVEAYERITGRRFADWPGAGT